jgi:hypothetical protein
MNSASSDNEGKPVLRHPLAAISLIVLIVALVIPIALYTIAPEGQLRENDLVYSTGRHRVYYAAPRKFEQSDRSDYCVIEPRDKLVIVQRLEDSLLAKVEPKVSKDDIPFCPPGTTIVVKAHQVRKKEPLMTYIMDSLTGILPR